MDFKVAKNLQICLKKLCEYCPSLSQSMSIHFTNKIVHKSTGAQNKKLLLTFMLTLNDKYQIKHRKSFDTKAVHKMLV